MVDRAVESAYSGAAASHHESRVPCSSWRLIHTVRVPRPLRPCGRPVPGRPRPRGPATRPEQSTGWERAEHLSDAGGHPLRPLLAQVAGGRAAILRATHARCVRPLSAAQTGAEPVPRCPPRRPSGDARRAGAAPGLRPTRPRRTRPRAAPAPKGVGRRRGSPNTSGSSTTCARAQSRARSRRSNSARRTVRRLCLHARQHPVGAGGGSIWHASILDGTLVRVKRHFGSVDADLW